MKSILAIIVGHALTLSARFSQLDTTETLVRMASILSMAKAIYTTIVSVVYTAHTAVVYIVTPFVDRLSFRQ